MLKPMLLAAVCALTLTGWASSHDAAGSEIPTPPPMTMPSTIAVIGLG